MNSDIRTIIEIQVDIFATCLKRASLKCGISREQAIPAAIEIYDIVSRWVENSVLNYDECSESADFDLLNENFNESNQDDWSL
jgi:hypothetical protein